MLTSVEDDIFAGGVEDEAVGMLLLLVGTLLVIVKCMIEVGSVRCEERLSRSR